ncbi:class I SAM-dependent methyltransferase [Pseudonocardia asaccharolytica]|uniref:class I SAM-dependent methyltransferase n=1 Tax=Pseudonocardia asaccharolytica TaxID=54010 RepID=UPI0021BEB10C|nr:class I SAM-dependent methyltransferase [Pseudonocardia asaccharolytica]
MSARLAHAAGRLMRGAVGDAVAAAMAERRSERDAAIVAQVRRGYGELSAQLDRELAELRSDIGEQVRAEADRAVAEIRAAELRGRRDLAAAGERDAAATSARFVHDEMADAVALPTPVATLEHALAIASKGGMALEFGVYTGRTLAMIAASRPDDAVYGFDSFAGLPETWRPGFPVGVFDDIAGPPEVSGAEIVVGLFDETLPGFLAAHPGPVDLLHIDSDLHSSAATVLAHVGPRLGPGSVVVFDEFFNYPGWEDHEARAWRDHVAAHPGLTFRYEAYTIDNEQVVVRITGEDRRPGAAR